MERFLGILTGAVLAVTPVFAQDLAIPFVDEGETDPGFVAYRAEFLSAVVAQDVEHVISLTAPEIHLSFGDDYGHERLRDMLVVEPESLSPEYQHLAKTMQQDYWNALEDVLRMGGVFNGPELFIAPYQWSAEFPDTLEPYWTYFTIGSPVALRDRPSRWATEVSDITGEVVELVDGETTEGAYWHVRRLNGDQGYVDRAQLRALLDYRAFFERRDGQWLMTLFLAGD